MHDILEKIKSKVRTELINALDSIDIEHKVSVNEKLLTNRPIDYSSEELAVKSAKLTRKVEKGTGVEYYTLKVVVEG